MIKIVGLVLFFIGTLCANAEPSKKNTHLLKVNNPQQERVVADVQGMVCDFCAQGLEKVFEKEKSVQAVEINLDESQVTLILNMENNLDNQSITKIIRENGINTVTINRRFILKEENQKNKESKQ